jgi:hypothetical protein
LFFALVISPDVLHNTYFIPNNPGRTYASYADHLSRFGGIGFNPYPLWFYFGTVRDWLGWRRLGVSLNPWVGAILLLGVLAASFRRNKDPVMVFFLVMFWTVFLFFSLYRSAGRGGAKPMALKKLAIAESPYRVG